MSFSASILFSLLLSFFPKGGEDMDGQNQTYAAQYPAYFDDAPLVERFGGVLGGYDTI